MPTDDIYATNQAGAGSFEFNESVAAVFPDMLRRSIPGYAATIRAISSFAARHVVAGSRCYDLGCSLGAATIAMRDNITAAKCRIVAVDSSSAMIRKCREAVGPPRGGIEVSIVEADIRNVDIKNASMVVMNYTLQFLPVAERAPLLGKIYQGLRPGGIFVLSEKVIDEDAAIENLLVGLHHEFKRRNAYSDLEISRKRTALENVLVAETESAHRKKLRNAGFGHVGVWLRYFNFISIVSIK
jgi:tRNA (cmo5U34)-methyltransferase